MMGDRQAEDEQERLTAAERTVLLRHARQTLICALTGRPLPSLTDPPPSLLRPAAAFVSLHRGNKLRGCVGVLNATKPLADLVAEMTSAAALTDPRFPPVDIHEVSALTIEISVLSQPRPIDPADVVVGKHGLVIIQGTHRGVLLPQVATEHGWDRESFLTNTCVKAGLAPDAWREAGTSVLAFTAQVFGESPPQENG